MYMPRLWISKGFALRERGFHKYYVTTVHVNTPRSLGEALQNHQEK